jgi:hypothetical protein
MEEQFTYPTGLTNPIHNAKCAPVIPPAPADFDSGYMDGTVQAYPGANPGRDQDRSRQDEYIPASFTYKGTAVGSDHENETGSMEGF